VGYDVNVWSTPEDTTGSGRKFAMIGYHYSAGGSPKADPITGSIHVQAENDVSIIANRNAVGAEGYAGWGNSPSAGGGGNLGYNAFAQIGHGGREALRTSNLGGAITVEAGVDITAQAGKSRENYAMIGHGGYDNKQGVAPPVAPSVTPESTATIGDAIIIVSAGGDVDFRAGIGNAAFAQIGNGGLNHVLDDFTASDITVTAGGDVVFHGGTGGAANGSISYAQLGHGGYDSDMTTDSIALGNGFAGAITVNAGGKIEFLGGDDTANYAQLGNGGYATNGDHSGAITINNLAAGVDGLIFSGGSGNQTYAQVGNGGYGSKGDYSGAITVNAGAAGIDFNAGSGTATYVQIGHGGYDADGNTLGAVTVATTGNIDFSGGTGDYTYVQIGNGGYANSGDHDGVINVSAGTGVAFTGGEGYFASAQIGNGGSYAAGNSTGSITVDAGVGALNFTAGGDTGPGSNGYTWAQIGHGGYQSGITGGTHSGAIDVDAGEINFQGGTTGQAYAQIGHGGYNSDSDHLGDIMVTTSVGDIVFDGGSATNAYAQIGHGGNESRATNGVIANPADISVNSAGQIDFTGGSANQSQVQIGHGGHYAYGDVFGAISVTGNGVSFTGGSGYFASAQIGHGGRTSANPYGNLTGDISVDAGAGVLSLTGGTVAANSYQSAQIGHGGAYSTYGNHSGEIIVTAGDVVLQGGTQGQNFAQIGHALFAHTH